MGFREIQIPINKEAGINDNTDKKIIKCYLQNPERGMEWIHQAIEKNTNRSLEGDPPSYPTIRRKIHALREHKILSKQATQVNLNALGFEHYFRVFIQIDTKLLAKRGDAYNRQKKFARRIAELAEEHEEVVDGEKVEYYKHLYVKNIEMIFGQDNTDMILNVLTNKESVFNDFITDVLQLEEGVVRTTTRKIAWSFKPSTKNGDQDAQ